MSALVSEMGKLRLKVDGKHSVTLPTWDESGLRPASFGLLSLHPTASLLLLAGVPGPSKSWWTHKFRAGAKEGTKLGTMRRPELSPKTLGMESEGCRAPESSLGTAPLLPGTSCPGPTACPGTCWAPPRRCPWLRQVPRPQQSVGWGWAGGRLGPSRTPQQLRQVQSTVWPLQPSLAKSAQGISLGQICLPHRTCFSHSPALPHGPLLVRSLGPPPSGVGGASCPFAILKKYEGNWEGQARAEGGGGFCPFVRLHWGWQQGDNAPNGKG